jgi:hypothetical protein
MSIDKVLAAIGGMVEQVQALAIRAHNPTPFYVGSDKGRSGVLLRDGLRFEDLTEKLEAQEQRRYDLEEKRGIGPRRIEAKHTAQTLEGFIDYVNRHKSETTAISAQFDTSGKPQLVATIDFHGKSDGKSGPDPRWGKHVVVYQFPFALVFRQWQGASQWMDKKRFLDWVETHAVELAHPAEITEAGELTSDIFNKVLIVRGWDKEKRTAAFASNGLSAVFGSAAELFQGAKLMNGSTSESLEETIDDMGQVAISYKRSDKVENAVAKRYYLADIMVFDGDVESRCVPVRLDLAVDGGKLCLSLHLIGVEKIVEASFLEACSKVAESTGIAPIRAVF